MGTKWAWMLAGLLFFFETSAYKVESQASGGSERRRSQLVAFAVAEGFGRTRRAEELSKHVHQKSMVTLKCLLL